MIVSEMGGYGFYVWGSYLVTLIALLGSRLLLNQSELTLKHLSSIPQSNK